MTDQLPQDGLVAVVKRDCPTCVLAAPVLGALARDAGTTGPVSGSSSTAARIDRGALPRWRIGRKGARARKRWSKLREWLERQSSVIPGLLIGGADR
jgi:hypothetical protein